MFKEDDVAFANQLVQQVTAWLQVGRQPPYATVAPAASPPQATGRCQDQTVHDRARSHSWSCRLSTPTFAGCSMSTLGGGTCLDRPMQVRASTFRCASAPEDAFATHGTRSCCHATHSLFCGCRTYGAAGCFWFCAGTLSAHATLSRDALHGASVCFNPGCIAAHCEPISGALLKIAGRFCC